MPRMKTSFVAYYIIIYYYAINFGFNLAAKLLIEWQKQINDPLTPKTNYSNLKTWPVQQATDDCQGGCPYVAIT